MQVGWAAALGAVLAGLGSPAHAADAAAAARGLARRVLGAQAARITFEVIAPPSGSDAFELATHGGRLTIRGNSAVSMAAGLNWYLKHVARRHVSFRGSRIDLPDALPPVDPPVRRSSWARHRYFLNYCCFGYSLPWWDWRQWERLIDWMALQGVTMPLAVTGQEAVWEAVGRRFGLTTAEMRDFLAGPPYLPFQWMGCLDGHGGPLPTGWTAQHARLQRRILARQRELGMTPVLQGFTGHVPAALVNRHPRTRTHEVAWAEWRTRLLDPLDPLFGRVADAWMEEQERLYGRTGYYAADTFIEMAPPRGDLPYLADLGKAIYQGMARSDPSAVWVLQGWAFMFSASFWTQPRIAAFLDATADDRMVVLDLFCESAPMWSRTSAFYGKPWLWCNVQNFGATVGIGAALETNNTGLHAARANPAAGSLAGVGFVNEGLCTNPAAYDLLFEQAWRSEPVDLGVWLDSYAGHRYGSDSPAARRAWRALAPLLNTPSGGASLMTAAPNLRPTYARRHTAEPAIEAWSALMEAAPEFGRVDTFRFDLVNVARQALANHSAVLHRQAATAYRKGERAAFQDAARQFLDLMRDVDALLATRGDFLLGRWLADARRWGATEEERRRMEWNARRVITLWGETPALDDYARKEWAGMLAGYYLPRWQRYLDAAAAAMRDGKPLDEAALAGERVALTARWAEETRRYPERPRGDSVEVAGRLWRKYGPTLRQPPPAPDAPSLTTGKPATCSHALQGFPAGLANDGVTQDPDGYWATDVTQHPDAWWQVDLGAPTTVGRVVVVCYYGDVRTYGFTVEGSTDGTAWEMLADRRDNGEPSTQEGYACAFAPRPVRYLRVTQTRNSANTGRHLVEVMAYAR